jgi:UrcA family protein
MNTLANFSLALGLSFAALAANAGSVDAPATRTVEFPGLDMTRSEGAGELYRQLKFAARDVCARADGKSLAEKASFRACADMALANAVAQVNSPLLTSLHETTGKAAVIRVATR